jgi:hypothetical protein
MLDLTKPIRTRDGREAKFYEKTGKNSFSAFIKDEHNPDKWVLHIYYSSGRLLFDTPCGDDIVNVVRKRTGWMNIYKARKGYFKSIAYQSGVYETREEAVDAYMHANKNGVPLPDATVKIEWEER